MNNNNADNQDLEWSDPKGNQPNIVAFTNAYSADINNVKVHSYVDIEYFYALLVIEEMLESISEQTNIYAMQMQEKNTSDCLDKWVPTDK